MKRIGKVIGIVAIIVASVIFVAFVLLNEKRPQITESAEADQLAMKLLDAVNKQAWDSTNVITWQYKGGHTHIWDKKNKLVSVVWGSYHVLLNLQTWEKGKAFKENKEITGPELDVVRGKAWQYFCNDSFWLIAPFKVFDEGTTRSLVKNEAGGNDLLVSYASGGVTPGDAYLWQLDERGLPKSYKMWVKILPIGGVEATWENWVKQSSGAMIATTHQLGPLKIPILSLKTGVSLAQIGLNDSVFEAIR